MPTIIAALQRLALLTCIFGALPVSSAIAQIEYKTVDEARTALLALPGTKVQKTRDGWLIVNIPGPEPVSWSFAPESHEAAPAVGKRVLKKVDGRFSVTTHLLCEATKAACDRLNSSYKKLDAQMMEAIQKGQ